MSTGCSGERSSTSTTGLTRRLRDHMASPGGLLDRSSGDQRGDIRSGARRQELTAGGGGVAGQVGSRLGPARDLELGQDAGDVVLDRLLGQVEFLTDLLVGPAGRDQLQDAFFLGR